MDVDLEELAAIIEQLDKTEFTDFFFEKGDLRIRVLRGGHLAADVAPSASSVAPTAATAGPVSRDATMPAAVPREAATSAPVPPAPTVTATVAPATAAPASPVTDGQPADGVTLVRAPMLGHFYRAPKPGEEPFVQVGDVVEADSVLCIIEVMKLMNSVPAGVAGEVVEVLVEDGALVEFDQPIFAVRRPG
ncbi:acetyl-CoA carboxylase biotin carboxyl carrier protein [Georgenia daeguensis]|uniref:Biotin carboxyl carrier protein of acetyl-CoA carboxylase n=1 Tax=Georgenia daeguensis TaxID=908355 RepID=A0ABP8EWC8_9MICO